MRETWRSTLKTIALTAALTTLFWFCLLIWFVAQNPRFSPFPSPTTAVTSAPVAAADGRSPVPRKTARSTPAVPDGKLLIPVAGVLPEELTDTFTQARAGGARRHDAIDIMAPRGTPVIAAGDGTVEKLFTSKDGGLTVYVRSADRRRIHYYAHLDGYAPGLAEGATVKTGDAIGTVGFTGNANPAAPHLHFEVMTIAPDQPWYGAHTSINPYPLMTRS